MVDSRVRGSRRPGFVVTVLMLFALVVLMLAVALPAQASTVVKAGNTQMTVKANVVTHLQTLHVSIAANAPMTYKPQWASGNLQWWYQAPMSNDGTVYNTTTKQGLFYHWGWFTWVEASGVKHKTVKWQGLRVIASGASSYSLSAAVGNAPSVRMIVASASNTPKITKTGKAIRITGVQFKLTTAGAANLLATLGETVSTSVILFDTDLLFTMQ